MDNVTNPLLPWMEKSTAKSTDQCAFKLRFELKATNLMPTAKNIYVDSQYVKYILLVI